VFCRCQPLNAEEIAEGALTAIDFESAKYGELIVKGTYLPKKYSNLIPSSALKSEDDQGSSFYKAIIHFACIVSMYPILLTMYLIQPMCRKGV